MQKPDHTKYMFWSSFRTPQHPRIFRLGLLVFVAGMIGGLLFVAIAGPNSSEFQRYFASFIALYVIGTVLVLLGK